MPAENKVVIKANVEIFFHVRFLLCDYFIEQALYQGSPYLPALNWMIQIRRDGYLTKVVQILLKFVLSFHPNRVFPGKFRRIDPDIILAFNNKFSPLNG